MIASQCSFFQMMMAASGNFTLAEATSFIQVEYGIAELQACWDGFVHSSESYGQKFKSRKDICNQFADALTEYIECHCEPSLGQMG
jgi:hypothetical protein